MAGALGSGQPCAKPVPASRARHAARPMAWRFIALPPRCHQDRMLDRLSRRQSAVRLRAAPSADRGGESNFRGGSARRNCYPRSRANRRGLGRTTYTMDDFLKATVLALMAAHLVAFLWAGVLRKGLAPVLALNLIVSAGVAVYWLPRMADLFNDIDLVTAFVGFEFFVLATSLLGVARRHVP